ncbi:MAG: hypothetical protein HYX27_10465 [Acidobacteria bacterium]|nr:hypothetical protein [Acidobacteriota bacterium]
MKRVGLTLALVAMAACTPLPESYPVPEQRQQKDGPEPEPLGRWIRFSDGRAADYVISGFLRGAPDDTWRWASTNPTVRVRVSEAAGLRLRLNFAFPEESHKPLLPITVKYFVNDHLLDTVVYRKAGVLEYRKPVPADWLKTDVDNLIRWEIDPPYVAKADGVKLSMIVAEVGLERNQ